jgi:hypothetical protein
MDCCLLGPVACVPRLQRKKAHSPLRQDESGRVALPVLFFTAAGQFTVISLPRGLICIRLKRKSHRQAAIPGTREDLRHG